MHESLTNDERASDVQRAGIVTLYAESTCIRPRPSPPEGKSKVCDENW